MVSNYDMGLIASLGQASGGGKGASKAPMGNKPPEQPAKPPQDPNAVNNPMAAGVTAEPGVGGQAGAADLVGKPDTSQGLGEMGSKDKLNMITKMYGGGMGLA